MHGDTNLVIARKVDESSGPRWLHPVYHSSVAVNRANTVPPDVADLRRYRPATLGGIRAQRLHLYRERLLIVRGNARIQAGPDGLRRFEPLAKIPAGFGSWK